MPLHPAPAGLQPNGPLKRRLVFLQNCSIFEGYGGIEYYQDDFLSLAAELYSGDAVWSILPRRTSRFAAQPREYRTEVVPFSRSRWLQKLQNRFSLRYFQQASAAIDRLKPSFILSSHITLAPLAFALSRVKRIPYLTLAYGIEAWGGGLPHDEWCFRHSDGILSISHWTKRLLVRRGFVESKIQVVQPILPREYEQIPYSARERAADAPLTLLTVSRLDAREQYKGQDHVLRALQRLRGTSPSLRFRYIIQGEGSDKARLQRLTQDLKLNDIVEFRPRALERKDLAAVYREADLFVMPSRFGHWGGRWRGEGFGIVYLEAAAFGLPSLAYDCGGATDIIRQGENGVLVPPDDLDGLAQALERLATHREQLSLLGEKAHHVVMTRFTPAVARHQLAGALEHFQPITPERDGSPTTSRSR